jgi:5'-methylthioadenosine phosphorylase
MCYVNLSLITDYDSGLEGVDGIAPVSYDAVMQVLRQENDRLRGLLGALIGAIDPERSCTCRAAISGSHG